MSEDSKAIKSFHKAKNKTGNKKSLSRLISVQVLYQYDFHNQETELPILMDELLDNYVLDGSEAESSSYRDKIDMDLLGQLLSGILLALPKIDEEITEFLRGTWEIKTLPDIMLPILRFGVFELKYLKDIPLKVIINEYVDIAGCFYDDQKITFVNRILENIAAKIRPEEFSKVKK